MSSAARRRVVFGLVAAGILTAELHAFLTPPRDVFRTAWRARDLAAFSRGAVVSQVFSVAAQIEPLTGVSIRVRATGGSARIGWTLESCLGSECRTFTTLSGGTRTVAAGGEAWVTLAVPPTAAWNRKFRLSVRLLDVDAASVRLRYSPTGAYPGILAADGKEELGDLLLAAVGESLHARVRRLLATSQSPSAAFVAGGAVLLYHAALFGLVYFLVFSPRQS